MKVTILCSAADPASRNIKNQLLQCKPWEEDSTPYKRHVYESFELVEIKERLIFADNIDRKLKTDLIIFASRHKSETDPRPLLTAHFTGNVGDALYGGKARQFVRAAPGALRSLLLNLKKFSNIEVTLEATHHGPSQLMTPSVFVELGSSETQWRNENMASAVAHAIIELDFNLAFSKCPTAVGFGGNHYATRHTELLYNSDICYGHIFSMHQLQYLDQELIQYAFKQSGGDFAYFDRKYMARLKEKTEFIVKSLNYEILRAVDIKEHGGVYWQDYLELRQLLKSTVLSDADNTLRISRTLNRLKHNNFKKVQLTRVSIKLDLVHEAQKVDRNGVRLLLESEPLLYYERRDGLITDVVTIDDDQIAKLITRLQDGCIEILKAHYDIEYSGDMSKLYIIENKFNPQLARTLGVTPGPLFAELARGKSISVDGRIIRSEDVYAKTKKVLEIN